MKKDWTYKKLGEVAKVQNGFAFDSKLFNESGKGTPLIRIRDIKRSQTFTYTTEDCPKDFFVENGDLLIGMDGDFNVCTWEGGHAYLNQRVCHVIPSDKVLSRFLLYLLPFPLKLINDKTTFATVKHLSSKQVNDINIPVPSLSEQQAIVSRLDSAFAQIDALKANAEKQLEEARKLFQAELTETMKPKEGWEKKSLNEISKYSIGLTYKPSDVNDDGTIVLRSSNIQNDNLDLNDIVRVTCAIKESLYVQKGDILMCARNGSAKLVGKVAILPETMERMTYGTFMMIIRGEYNPYLFYFFKSDNFRNQIKHGEANMINQITRYMLDDVVVNVPPKSEVKEIVSRLDALSANVKRLEELQQKTLAECDALKQAMLREVFE